MRTISMVLFSIAVAFICIGLTANRTFLYVGVAFMVMAIARLVRASKQ